MAKPISAIILTVALIGLTVRPISFALQTTGIEFPVSALKYESQTVPILEGQYAMEAYFSHDGSKIIYQGREGDRSIYPHLDVLIWDFQPWKNPITPPRRLTDNSKVGRTNAECTFFSPNDKYIVFAAGRADAKQLDLVDFGGYPYYYDLTKEVYIARLDDVEGTLEQVTHNSAYEAETSFSPPIRNNPRFSDGIYLLYTSSRSGNLDLWMQKVFDVTGERHVDGPPIQLTNAPLLQEGGAFFMPDGKRIVYRAWDFDPVNPHKEEMERDRTNLRPMQIHILNIETMKDEQITSGDARNWAPFPHPSEEMIVFSKRDFSVSPNNFDIYVLDLRDKGNPKQIQITTYPGFDGYPVFNPAGNLIMFTRYFPRPHDPSKSLFRLYTIPFEIPR